MAYTPPVGTVDLALTGSYTPPVGTANLNIRATATPERLALVAGETLAPTGLIVAARQPLTTISGETLAPTGSILMGRYSVLALAGETVAPTGAIRIMPVIVGALAGETLAPIGRLDGAYDPNLLSAVQAATATPWQDGAVLSKGVQEALQAALPLQAGPDATWRAAAVLSDSESSAWQDAAALTGMGGSTWMAANLALEGRLTHWQNAPHLDRSTISCWNEAETWTTSVIQFYQPRPPLFAHAVRPVWQDGALLTLPILEGGQDGRLLIVVDIAVWQQAGYPGNAPHPGPPLPPPPAPHQWGTDLQIRCPLPGTALRIGRTPCVLIAEREIPKRRTYMSSNSASLVRWPDLVPLPCTDITVETDFDSWCWALSATLAGPDAWALVQPDPLACQVQATINGQIWRFLLDVPSTQRSFDSDRVSLKGRSRSAWLQAPYASQQDFSELNPREMQQLAEAALENTGWTVDWKLENWVVPASLWTQYSTPIDVLLRLAAATDDGVYTQPTEQIITLHPRWPVASWLLDAETADLLIPEAAVISLSQLPVYTQPLNGVYVSGTTQGTLALIKIAGTDGALQPEVPLTEALLCDAAGVAARRRGLNALSDSGAGFEMDAEVLFTPEIGLVRPGMIVSIAGLKGISRSCRISAQWSGDSLLVRQSVGLERREVEA